MTRLHWILAAAALSLLTAVVAVGASLTTQTRNAGRAASVHGLIPSSGSIETWPAPEAPFDETVITPFESAGAPMVL